MARLFADLGYALVATEGTAAHLAAHGVPVDMVVAKLGLPRAGDAGAAASHGEARGTGVDAVQLMAAGKIDLVVNTPRGRARAPTATRSAGPPRVHKVSCLTTVPAALAAARSLAERVRHPLKVRSLQEFHARPVDDQLRLGI